MLLHEKREDPGTTQLENWRVPLIADPAATVIHKCQQVLGEYGAEDSSHASSSGVIQGSGMRTISFKRTNKL
jgi:hypothetical protein